MQSILKQWEYYEKNIDTVSTLFKAYVLAQCQAVQGEHFPHFPIQDRLAGRPPKVFLRAALDALSEYYYWLMPAFFFLPICGNKRNWIFRNLEFREKIL